MADAEAPRRPGALGTPTDHVEVALVDADDHPVSVGEVGEIGVRPRHPDAMYAGYWGNPEATVKTWRNLWHHTGDLARSDADGNLSFVDRKKDAIRRRGENVSSVEVEVALRGHPSVASVAVYAVPSPLGEDDIMAAVVLAPGSELDPGEVFRFCQANLPYFAIPRYLDVRPSLPLNALGRVMKHALRDEGVTATTWDFEALGLAVPREERRG
jgi:crotonobetaine/carnitine-CoA ligase